MGLTKGNASGFGSVSTTVLNVLQAQIFLFLCIAFQVSQLGRLMRTSVMDKPVCVGITIYTYSLNIEFTGQSVNAL